MLYAREKSSPPIGQKFGIGNLFSANGEIVIQKVWRTHIMICNDSTKHLSHDETLI